MADLFDQQALDHQRKNAPLADRMRPRALEEFHGQEDLLAPGKFLRQMIDRDELRSLLFWGPPGTGKTTLARLLAGKTRSQFAPVSAVNSGVKDLQKIIQTAEETRKYEKRGTVLFIDEIHRFNKTQQDTLLHAVENGTVTLVGATTENPSFEVNSALLSRCQVLTLKPLSGDALRRIAGNALVDKERGLGGSELTLTADAETFLIQLAQGDARTLLNFLELAALKAVSEKQSAVTADFIREATGKRALLYDKSGEEHYNLISAFIKSMRGSDPDAAVYYLARMLEGGEDPLFLARRLVIFASEDVGNADPQALPLAVACKDAVHFIGMPEAFYPLTQAALYLALAPKSNSAGSAYGKAMEAVNQHGPLPSPMHIRNAPTRLMKDLGYGREYRYPHDYEENFVAEEYLPDAIAGRSFFTPGAQGFEKEIAKRLAYWKKLKQEGLQKRNPSSSPKADSE